MLKKIFPIAIIALVLAINLFLGLTRLKNYSAVDEPYWTYQRTPKFWNAVLNAKWSKTDINDKPGITVALLSGAGLLKIDPLLYKELREKEKTPEQLEKINTINFFFRLPIFLLALALLPLFYWLLRKLFDETTALIGFLFISLSPILLGISLIINPDSFMWLFAPISILAYFVFQKTKKFPFLIMCGLFTGLSLLTKYVANILYVFFFLLPFLEYIFAKEKPAVVSYLKKSAKDYLVIAAVSMLTFFVLYPATWTDPKILLEGTFLSRAFEKTWPLFVLLITIIATDMLIFKNKFTDWVLDFFLKFRALIVSAILGVFSVLSLLVLANTYLSMKFFNFETIVASPKNNPETFTLMKGFGNILADVYGLLFGLHPIVLAGILFFIIIAFIKRKSFDRELSISFYLMIFILLYYLASTANFVVATVRYQIMLYPLAFIISAVGIIAIFKKFFTINLPRQSVLVVVVISCLLFSLFSIRPFYLTYASVLLPEKYTLNFKDMGDGSFEAAQYLNSLPNQQDIRIWSDKGAVCAVSLAKCSADFDGKAMKKLPPDFIVISSGRKRKTIGQWSTTSSPISFSKAYEIQNPEFLLTFGRQKNNFVKVIKTSTIAK
ncbi:MAG TPA: phospholipid carrier-dependent glycosyltransferase [Candidatus Moranbacteria bacterium]|nr:phospholipid carrier-dependent glycosyltransferase [Candidatus Moranbacteria bacterium]HSA08407.1 phospholipid carrier-dependent glycosyltransferase [Candidatus Moranbacteria bacterium]